MTELSLARLFNNKGNNQPLRLNEHNVVAFSQDSVRSIIELYLSKRKSRNTENAYRSTLVQFFSLMLGKEDFADISWEDISNIGFKTMELYTTKLEELGDSGRTINTKVCTIKSLWNYMSHDNPCVNLSVTKVEKVNEDKESGKYGALNYEEVEGLYKYCDTLKTKPLEQRLFFELGMVTAIRTKALLNITWRDFNSEKQSDGSYIWYIRVFDKGNWDNTPITNEMMEKLCKIKKGLDLDRKLFTVNVKTLAKTLRDYCASVGIPEERNIVLHSIKKSSMDFVYLYTKDIVMTARHGHHKGFEMAYQNYLDRNKKLEERPSYNMFDSEDMDIRLLNELSKEQLINIIGQMNRNGQIELLGLANRMYNIKK